MRSIEDKGCLSYGKKQEVVGGSSTMNYEFHHRTVASGKPTPSKWDDAQKWLVNLSRGGGEKHQSKASPRNSNADDLRLIVPVPKKEEDYSSGSDEGDSSMMMIQFGVETKKVDNCDDSKSMWRINKAGCNSNSAAGAVRSICVRDMGTEMTPIASQEPSRTGTPIRARTPAARSPISSGSSTPPIRGQNGVVQTIETGQIVATAIIGDNRGNAGATRIVRGVEETINNELTANKETDNANNKLNPLETRAMVWDEAERAKYMARYKREEVKIQAWENHEKRKAEMEMKRMEVKAERIKARAEEKYRNKLASARRKAEEKRANAEAQLNEKTVKICEKADYIRRTGHLPSSFSFKLPSSSCW
ncbi:remorin 1.4 [Capsicum galapagoense]